jgi:ribosome-binding protein aMBF1 (putative translation factor)
MKKQSERLRIIWKGIQKMKEWNDVRIELYDKEAIEESNMRVALMGELIKARHEQGISQRKLEEMSGIKQPMIAKIESGNCNPQIETIIKLLVPLGKTLAIVPMK